MSLCERCGIHAQFDGVSGKPADGLCTICRDDARGEVDRCPSCGEPTHATESDDTGRCEGCRSVVFVVFYRSGGFVACASPEAAARLMIRESPDAKDEIDAWLAALPTDEHDEWSLVTNFYTVCRAPVEGP